MHRRKCTSDYIIIVYDSGGSIIVYRRTSHPRDLRAGNERRRRRDTYHVPVWRAQGIRRRRRRRRTRDARATGFNGVFIIYHQRPRGGGGYSGAVAARVVRR